MKKSGKIYKNKALLVIKLALVVILGHVVIRTVLMPQRMREAFVPNSAVGTENVTAVQAAIVPDTSVQDYSAIVEQDIFGTRASSLGTKKSLQGDNGAGPAQSGEEELGIALLGTVAGSPEISRAIIKNLETNVLSLYKTGDSVVTGSIESIEKDTVVLLHQGQRKILNLRTREFKRHDADNGQATATLALAKNATQAVETNPAAKSHATFADKLRDAAVMLPKAIIEPYAVEGQVEGLRITGLENIKGAEDLGLKNGDVIRAVNGHRVDSKQKAYQIAMKARSQAAMSIELLRDSKIKTFSFSLR